MLDAILHIYIYINLKTYISVVVMYEESLFTSEMQPVFTVLFSFSRCSRNYWRILALLRGARIINFSQPGELLRWSLNNEST